MVKFEYKITFENDPDYPAAWRVTTWERDCAIDGPAGPWRGARLDTVHVYPEVGCRRALKGFLRRFLDSRQGKCPARIPSRALWCLATSLRIPHWTGLSQ